MTRPLGSASSIPREGTPQTPMKEAARGGEAEPNDRVYRCESCGETFISAWSESDAKAEAESTFSAAELSDTAVVCEYCWQAMRKAMPDLDARYNAGDRPTNPSDYAHEDQNPGSGGDARSAPGARRPLPDPQLLASGFSPSNVQLALAHAHVAWAKRHAPHLLEEWLR